MSDATVIESLRAALKCLSSEEQEKVLNLTIKLSLQAAMSQRSPVHAAGDFWMVFMELFKLLLPLIIELIKSGGD